MGKYFFFVIAVDLDFGVNGVLIYVIDLIGNEEKLFGIFFYGVFFVNKEFSRVNGIFIIFVFVIDMGILFFKVFIIVIINVKSLI